MALERETPGDSALELVHDTALERTYIGCKQCLNYVFISDALTLAWALSRLWPFGYASYARLELRTARLLVRFVVRHMMCLVAWEERSEGQ